MARTQKKQDSLDIIIPIYNEEACIDELLKRLLKLKKKMITDTKFIFVNDGSKDKSLNKLSEYADKYNFIKIINLSRNFGHQIAITAGLDYSNSDYVVIIDADLQDPPEIIEEMYNQAKTGCDVIYGQRFKREGETLFKKMTARFFYLFINKMCDVKIPMDTGDFRLMNKKVADVLRSMREKHRFIRGMVPWIGFKSKSLMYHRDRRFAGETKYPLRKMIRFAKDAIFSFSDKPLKIATYLGTITMFAGLIGAFIELYLRFFTTYYVSGISAVIVVVLIMSGVQIFMIGVTGEYVGRIFEESKKRPLYIIESVKNI